MQHIVIADDSRSIRTHLRVALTAAGLGVTEFADGEPIIDTVRSLVPLSA